MKVERSGEIGDGEDRRADVAGGNERQSLVASLGEQRKAALAAIAHLRFVQENFVDQALVKKGLIGGLTQSELAKWLGMSKRDVNRLARFPYTPAARTKDDRHGAIRAAFLGAVWGSDEQAQDALQVCRDYDAQRFEM